MKSRYIIFADDDADDLELITGFFKQYNRNINVLEFKDGKEVLKFLDDFALNADAPLLIVLDINMPLLNGKDVLRKIKEMPPLAAVPVVLFTTSSSPLDKEFAKKYNAGFITKPLDVAQMGIITALFIDHCSDEIKKNIRKQPN